MNQQQPVPAGGTPSEDFQFQLSVSLPPSEQYAKGDMVNIRGRSPQEFLYNLQAIDAHMADILGQVSSSIRAAMSVSRDLGGQTIQHDRQAPAQTPQNAPQSAPQQTQAYSPPAQQYAPQNGAQAPQQQAPAQPQGDGVPTSPPPHVGPAPQCSHGTKRFLAKPYRNGKPGYWMAWACPAERGDQSQHDLEFIDQRN